MEHSVNGSDVRPYWGRGTWRPLSWRFEPSGLTISQTASDLLFSEMRLFWHQKESFLIQIVVFKRKKPWVLANQSGLNSFPIRYHIEFTTCHFIPIFIDYVFHAEGKKGFQSTFSWTIAHKSTRSWAITFDDMYLMCVPYISVFVSETCLPPFEKKLPLHWTLSLQYYP